MSIKDEVKDALVRGWPYADPRLTPDMEALCEVLERRLAPQKDTEDTCYIGIEAWIDDNLGCVRSHEYPKKKAPCTARKTFGTIANGNAQAHSAPQKVNAKLWAIYDNGQLESIHRALHEAQHRKDTLEDRYTKEAHHVAIVGGFTEYPTRVETLLAQVLDERSAQEDMAK